MYLRTKRKRSKVPMTLPLELIHLILDEVIRAEDTPTLKAMSLTCTWFSPHCRESLFRQVTVAFASDGHYREGGQYSRNEVRQFQDFMAFLDAKPTIVRSIRQLILLDLSRIWSVPIDSPTWTTVSQPLCRLLARLEGLHGLEIRSEIQLDWTTFDAAIKRGIYGVFRRDLRLSGTEMPHLRIAGVVNIQDVDIWTLVSSAPAIALAHASFNLQGPDLKSFAGLSSHELLWRSMPETLKLGRSMGDNALDMVRHYPGILGRVRRLTIESLSAAAAVSQFWTVALASRETLEHLEWLLEDLAYRTQRKLSQTYRVPDIANWVLGMFWHHPKSEDARELQRLDLSVFPHLHSISIRSSQTGLLVNLMVILEATGTENRIESIKIIMPDNVDKFVNFVPSMVWKRLDTVLGGHKFRPHLRHVVLCFTWRHRPVSCRSLESISASFRRNLPSVGGNRLAVTQEKLTLL